MVILFSLPVALSFALTCKIPLASISKVTSILRHTAWRSRNTFQIKFTQSLVAGSHFTFTLIDLDRYGRLIVFSCRENLAELRWNGRVLLDHLRHDTAQGFDTQRQRGHIQQQQVFTIAGKNRTLQSCTDSNRFIRVDVFTRFLTEKRLDLVLNWQAYGSYRRPE